MSDYDVFATTSAVFLISFALTMLFVVAFYVLTAIAMMGFFRKVGVEPWIAWVPVYNNWKWLEIGGFQGWIALAQLIYPGGIVTSIFIYIGMYRTGIAFRKDVGFFIIGLFFPFIWAFILGGKSAVYEPQLITAAGYPPPIAGYGSLPYDQRAQHGFGPQAQQPYGQQTQQPPTGQPQPPYQPPQPPAV